MAGWVGGLNTNIVVGWAKTYLVGGYTEYPPLGGWYKHLHRGWEEYLQLVDGPNTHLVDGYAEYLHRGLVGQYPHRVRTVYPHRGWAEDLLCGWVGFSILNSWVG